MTYTYKPRGMPSRFMEKAPAIVRKNIIDILDNGDNAVCRYDVIFRDVIIGEMTGLDFGRNGSRGCHFFMPPHRMRDYRARNRRNRVAWHELPEATQCTILAYLEE